MNKHILHLAQSRWQLLLALCLTLLAAASCDDNSSNIHLGGNTGGQTTVTNNIRARMETPAVLDNGTTLLLSHSTGSGRNEVMTYSVEYDLQKLPSRWVAFRFDGNTRSRANGRSDEPFKDDPQLPASYRIGNNSFRSAGDYDRGHLCASADRLYSTEANEQTFYMTNMSPQLSSFNQCYWVTLEGLVQRKGRDASFSDTLYVVKGGTIRADQLNGYASRPNGKRVAIPKYYYMALLKVKNGVYSSIAFWMEHKDYGYKGNNKAPLSEMKKHAVSVNRLEQLTGIDFFPNLPDNLEETVEDENLPGSWGL